MGVRGSDANKYPNALITGGRGEEREGWRMERREGGRRRRRVKGGGYKEGEGGRGGRWRKRGEEERGEE